MPLLPCFSEPCSDWRVFVSVDRRTGRFPRADVARCPVPSSRAPPHSNIYYQLQECDHRVQCAPAPCQIKHAGSPAVVILPETCMGVFTVVPRAIRFLVTALHTKLPAEQSKASWPTSGRLHHRSRRPIPYALAIPDT
jgi:hypothetical protein